MTFTKFVNWIERDGVYAVYCNYHIYFFKGIAAQYFNNVIWNRADVPKSFLTFLIEKEILCE